MKARPWLLATSLPVLLALASCSIDADPGPETDETGETEEIAETDQATTSCTAPATGTGVCNVGISSDGYLAVEYRNAWWSADFAGGHWQVKNNVSATPITVTPTQSTTIFNPCDNLCNSCNGMVGSAQAACTNACNSCRATNPSITVTESLTYTVAVNGLTYHLEAWQQSMDTRARSGDQTIETRSQLSMEFRIGLTDPDDGNPWSVLILPRRSTSAPAPGGTITVVAGTYGGNAGAPRGNVTAALASACNGKPRCTYTIAVGELGDPVPGAGKDYVAEWTCGSQALKTSAAPEAGFGSIVNLSCGQEAINEAVTDGTIATGDRGTLVSNGNTSFTSEVELHGAVKNGGVNSPELVARSNAALNRALNTALPANSNFQQHHIPQAIQTLGKVTSIAPKGSSTGIYDMNRSSQFYMDNRKGNAGWSQTHDPQDDEEPQAESGPRKWRWRHRILDYNVYFPFLGGICGLEAGVHAYIDGSLLYGRESCFDGLATTIDAEGKLQFSAGAHGGLGCNIFVASASAGLESTINAGFEFKTHLQTVPPRLTGIVDIYSDLTFDAYFRVRVLFWSRKWQKAIYNARLFQKHTEYNFSPTLPDPGKQLCKTEDVPRGTCGDPLASCDVTGRCVRYDFLSTEPSAPPTRVDTGACLVSSPSEKVFDFTVEGRQYIPRDIPGLTPIPGKICSSSPPHAVDGWLHGDGIPATATVNAFMEPGIYIPLVADPQRFAGNDRFADTRPDRTRKTGLRWAGVMRGSNGPATVETTRWEPSHSWTLRFDKTSGCLIDAREGNAELSNFPGTQPPGTALGGVHGGYPFSKVAPEIRQSLKLHTAIISGSSLRFSIDVTHTNFPWHEIILRWKDKAFGLRDWGSTCQGPSIGAFTNFTVATFQVELRDDPGDPKVFVNGTRADVDKFPSRVTGGGGC